VSDNETKETEPKPPLDPRVYLAAERTFLAWIRTGLALMGFGFVVARFGLFLRELAYTGRTGEVPRGSSTGVGTGLVMLGVVLTIFAIARYVHLLRQLHTGGDLHRPSKLALFLGSGLAAIGLMMSLYLLLGS